MSGANPVISPEASAEEKVPPVQCLVRTKNTLSFFEGPFEKGYGAKRIVTIEDAQSLASYAADGSRFAVAGESSLRIYDADSYKMIAEIEAKGIRTVEMSPKGTYVITYEYLKKDGPENLLVWDIATKALVNKFTQKDETEEGLVQFTSDERYMCHITHHQINVFDGTAPSKLIKKIHVPKVKAFYLSPPTKDNKYNLAAFSPSHHDKPGCVAIYPLDSTTTPSTTSSSSSSSSSSADQPTAKRVMFKATDCRCYWNSLGSAVLIKTSQEEDSSAGSGYYRESSHLHFLTADGSLDCNITFGADTGSIVDVQWSPRTYDFVTLHGEARNAKATVWTAKDCKPIKELGSGPWNMIKYSPSGRFIALAGFGSLAGAIEVWDKNKFVRLGQWKDNDSPKSLEWTPCGRYLISATMFPWLRVDNQFKIYTYYGEAVYHERGEIFTQFMARPRLFGTYPDRPASPRILERAQKAKASPPAQVQAATKAYIPPHLRAQGVTQMTSALKQAVLSSISAPRDLTKKSQTSPEAPPSGVAVPSASSPTAAPPNSSSSSNNNNNKSPTPAPAPSPTAANPPSSSPNSRGLNRGGSVATRGRGGRW